MGHSAERLKCETCGGTYCPKCDSDCPACCIHRECQRQLREAQEELLVAKRNAESWQETAKVQRENYLALLEQREAARDAAIERAGAAERERDEARALGEGLYLLGLVWVGQRDRAETVAAELRALVQHHMGTLCRLQSHRKLDVELIRLIDDRWEMPAEAQEEGDE